MKQLFVWIKHDLKPCASSLTRLVIPGANGFWSGFSEVL